MNVVAHQEEKTGKRKAGEERKQANFIEAACYPAVVQRAARRKMVCVRRVPGVTGTLWKTNSNFNPNRIGDRTNMLRRLLIGVVQFCSLWMYILYIRLKFRSSLSKKIGVNTCIGDGQKVRNDD